MTSASASSPAALASGMHMPVAGVAGLAWPLDLDYCHVDMGRTESGWNAFGNARGMQDEKMQLDLVSSEITLGAHWAF